MKSGRMDRRVVLQRPTETKNAIGESVTSWESILEFWVEHVPLSSKEVFEFSRNVETIMVRFRCRWFEDIALTDRILWEGRNWDIRYLKEIGRRTGWDITCESNR